MMNAYYNDSEMTTTLSDLSSKQRRQELLLEMSRINNFMAACFLLALTNGTMYSSYQSTGPLGASECHK
jgi:hypothetical protein